MRDSVNNPLLRFVVDPNSVSRIHPRWSPVLLGDTGEIPAVDDWVFAVQPSPDEPDYVGLARVAEVDRENELLYLEVDWASFGEQRPSTANSTPFVPVRVRTGAVILNFPLGNGGGRTLTRTA